MPRSVNHVASRKRRKKILKMAKGFHFDRQTKFRHATQTVKRALQNAYTGRKLLKRDMRSLWIVRISAATKELGGSYSRFMGDLGKSGATINRKMLADLAATDFESFKNIYQSVTK